MDTALKEPFNREKQFAAKRRAVMRAASEAFRRRGYHNTSMTDIARALGLTKAALYYYVKNKEEVLFECHLMVYEAMAEVLAERRPKGQPGLDFLEDIFTQLVELLTRDGMSLLTDVNSLSGAWHKEVLKQRGKIERRITKIVKDGMADGSIRHADPRLTVFFFMGALNWLNAWYDPEGRVDGSDLARHFAKQMRAGIAV